jgi:hypothetical protein
MARTIGKVDSWSPRFILADTQTKVWTPRLLLLILGVQDLSWQTPKLKFGLLVYCFRSCH